MKVADLARELRKKPKDFIRFLSEVGIKVKSSNTRLDDGSVAEIRSLFDEEPEKTKEEENRVAFMKTQAVRISDLAVLLGVTNSDILTVTLKKGLLFNLNSDVEQQVAVDIAIELGVTLNVSDDTYIPQDLKEELNKIQENEVGTLVDDSDLIERPPVITIMGHVDHGKTLLLDTIRQVNVASTEAGGITQHIGAYQIEVAGKKLTFLDTPGHAAFTALRARGAQITDIVIIVVAADEGLKPQTIEAINHAKAASVPIIVAINKMDKPEADMETCKQALTEQELVPEEWGGTVPVLGVSAKTGEGVPALLEMIQLTADIQELKAVEKGFARGVVIESHLSKQRGPVATVLVKTGTLCLGNFFAIEHIYGKVRVLLNDQGGQVATALPGMPVEVLGLTDVPRPGSVLDVYKTDKLAKLAAKDCLEKQSTAVKKTSSLSLDMLSSQVGSGESKSVKLIIKADVHGSLEAIEVLLSQLSKEDISIQLVHSATGAVTESDVQLALASSAAIIAFNVTAHPDAQRLATSEKVDIQTYSVVYEIVDHVTKTLSGLFSQVFEEVELGRAQVRDIFTFSKIGVIAGSNVISGKMIKNSIATVLRDKKVVYTGKIESLKRFKDDVREVLKGYDCGIVLEKCADIKPDDEIVCFEMKAV